MVGQSYRPARERSDCSLINLEEERLPKCSFIVFPRSKKRYEGASLSFDFARIREEEEEEEEGAEIWGGASRFRSLLLSSFTAADGYKT